MVLPYFSEKYTSTWMPWILLSFNAVWWRISAKRYEMGR